MVPGWETAWYCVRSKPKHEHIAAANLRRLPALEVFNPRLRSRKATRRGPVWTTESLFPNYLFARFNFQAMFELVRYTEGVSSLVNFGSHYPEVPVGVIDELRRNFEGDEPALTDEFPKAGEPVTITTHAMFGLQGVVLRSLPASQRVQVLVDMLGQGAMVELSLDSVAREKRLLPEGLIAGSLTTVN